MPSLKKTLPSISVLSPNAEEALSLLGMPHTVLKASIEEAAAALLELGVGKDGQGCVIIRSGALGAYISTRAKGGRWLDAYWTSSDLDKVVDVTGAGNSFLGGFAAGLLLTNDLYEAMLYGTVSASFTIEQLGLPKLAIDNGKETWNGDSPSRRLQDMKDRHEYS